MAADLATALFSSRVFTPVPVLGAGKKGKLASLALVDKVPIIILPPAASDDTRRAFLFTIACCGTSGSRSLNAWKSFIATYVVANTPSFASRLPAHTYSITTLEESQVEAINNFFAAFRQACQARDQTQVESLARGALQSGLIPGLPLPDSALQWTDANNQWATKILIGHYSIVLFLIGKKIEGTDHKAIVSARPDAVKKKAHLSAIQGLLDGKLRLSDASHNLINSAWAELSTLRALVVSEYAKYAQSDTDFSQDLIYTTMHLLRWNGLQHARITMEFIRSYPWIVEIPALRTPLSVYVESMGALSRTDPVQRPFIKVIYGDKSPIFPRKELEPLVACAVKVATNVSETIKGFYVSNAFTAIVEAFEDELERRERIRTGELLQKERALGVTAEEDYEEEEEAGDEEPVPIGLPE